MIMQDILTPLYQEANQQFATLLVGDVGMYNAVDLALCDIYSYEGNHWDFMAKTQEFTFLESDPDTKTFTLNYSIVRLVGIFNNDGVKPVKVKFNVVASPFDVNVPNLLTAGKPPVIMHNQDYGVDIPVSFQSLGKTITLHKAGGLKQIISFYGWYNAPTQLSDTIPVPDAFKSCLRDLSLHYIIGPQGQYGEQKSGDLFNRGHIKLQHLAKSGLRQISNILFK